MDVNSRPRPQWIPCRLCQGEACFWFTKKVMNKHNIGYYQCQKCSHIQTEVPYWLEEVYKNLDFRRDVGIVSRSMKTAQLTLALALYLKIAPDTPCLDIGAGTGLLVRYCRDHGLNYYYDDPYSQNIFALGFDINSLKERAHISLMTAFEVFEHFANPSKDIEEIFGRHPDYLLLSTSLYKGQGTDWWYFLEDGQHVAVYTENSLKFIGERFGYYLYSDSSYHLFSKKTLSRNIVKKIRNNRESLAKRYKKKYGSRIESDFRNWRHCNNDCA